MDFDGLCDGGLVYCGRGGVADHRRVYLTLTLAIVAGLTIRTLRGSALSVAAVLPIGTLRPVALPIAAVLTRRSQRLAPLTIVTTLTGSLCWLALSVRRDLAGCSLGMEGSQVIGLTLHY